MATLVPFELPLSGAHVRMLNDGGFFLRYLDALSTEARIIPKCLTCGGPARVWADDQSAKVHCACRSGRVKTDQVLSLPALLRTLEWNLYCRDCGVVIQGENDPQGTVFTVRCPCTTRIYRMPVM